MYLCCKTEADDYRCKKRSQSQTGGGLGGQQQVVRNKIQLWCSSGRDPTPAVVEGGTSREGENPAVWAVLLESGGGADDDNDGQDVGVIQTSTCQKT